jgi:hypothetical protein
MTSRKRQLPRFSDRRLLQQNLPNSDITLDAYTVGAISIDMHPSAEIVRSRYPIATIWAMNSGERELAPIENWRGEDALVVRPYLDTGRFLLALAGGRTLDEAAEAAFAEDSNFDLIGMPPP